MIDFRIRHLIGYLAENFQVVPDVDLAFESNKKVVLILAMTQGLLREYFS
jgi:hypothetical protein